MLDHDRRPNDRSAPSVRSLKIADRCNRRRSAWLEVVNQRPDTLALLAPRWHGVAARSTQARLDRWG